jgi:hypothetical protein
MIARADEILEQGEGRNRGAGNVQGEKRDDELGRDVVRGLRQSAVDYRRHRYKGKESHEPGSRAAWPVEDESAERSREGPERDSPDSRIPRGSTGAGLGVRATS